MIDDMNTTSQTTQLRYASGGELHRDFHASILDGANYVRDNYGEAALREVLFETGTKVYRTMHEKLVAGDASELTLRIRNERNQASFWMQNADGEWIQDPEGTTDVSGFHHNNYNGFFALRPAYLLKGGAELKEFEYKPL